MNKIKVLVVEDDSALSMVICETLSIEGFSVFPAQDGVEGLNIFANQKIDVVVPDIMSDCKIFGRQRCGRISCRSRRLHSEAFQHERTYSENQSFAYTCERHE